jgi:hypothetical protein
MKRHVSTETKIVISTNVESALASRMWRYMRKTSYDMTRLCRPMMI